MNSKPLLLVDDDEAIVCMLKRILEDEGYTVDEAYTGTTAVEKITPKKYGLVILDFVLPDIKGDEVAERIRRRDPSLGIILLTGYKHSIDTRTLEKFERVLEKPAHPQTILSAIHGHLDRR